MSAREFSRLSFASCSKQTHSFIAATVNPDPLAWLGTVPHTNDFGMANFDWTVFNSNAFDTAALGDGMGMNFGIDVGMNSDVGVGMNFGGGTGINFGSGTDLNFMAGAGSMDFDPGSINFGADSRFSM